MRSASLSVVLGLVIVAAGGTPRAWAMQGPAAGDGARDRQYRDEGNALMDEGDAHQAAGAHAEAARAYAKAFDAFARRTKSDVKEKQAVSLAVDEFTAAQAQAPESLELLEEEAALLERFVARVGDETALVEERTRVKEKIEEVRREQAEAERREREAADAAAKQLEGEQTEGEQAKREQAKGEQAEGEGEQAKGEGEQAEGEQAKREGKQAEDEVTDSEPPALDPRSRRMGAVLVASGVVGLVGATVLVGVGVWGYRAADDRRDAQLAALDANEYPDEANIRYDLDQWHQRGRGIGVGLAVSGAVLAAAGIGLTAFGVVKLRRSRKDAGARARVVPMMQAKSGGVLVRVAF